MAGLNPLDWTAGPFLSLYLMLACGVLLLLAGWRNRLAGRGSVGPVDARGDGLGALHLAYLSGGTGQAAGVALVALLEAGAATPDRARRIIRFDPSVPVHTEFQPFRYVNGGEADRARFEVEFASRWQRLHDDLARRGLVPGVDQVARWRRQAVLVLCVPLLLGAGKVAVGMSRDRPVGILTLLLILTAVLGAVVLTPRPHRNLAGAAILAAARRAHARAARAPLPEEMALAYALTGSAVLAGREYRWALAPNNSSSSGSDGGSSDGGGGDGGCGGCSG